MSQQLPETGASDVEVTADDDPGTPDLMKVDKLRNGGGRAFRSAERGDYTAIERSAGYDAQSDLALPTADSTPAVDAFAPYAGELVPDAAPAGYDLGRDVGASSADVVPKKKHWWKRS
jgi:hypothetical protein